MNAASMRLLGAREWQRKQATLKEELPVGQCWLDIRAVCAKLRISKSTFYRLQNRGVIPEANRTLGERCPRWLEEDIDQLMKDLNGDK